MDTTRGFIVFLSIFTFSVPGVFSHAPWYGLTMLDTIFPAFVTIFGTSMAIAYRKGVSAKRLGLRTFRLIIFGLLFNMVAAWSLDLATLRFTGVLQLFAVLGVLTVVITKYIKRIGALIVLSFIIFGIYGASLLVVGAGCEDALPQMGCNPSHIIDPVIFGENHTYAQGERGHDPEGIPTIFSALGNVLLGFVAGKILLNKGKKVGMRLFTFSTALILLSLVVNVIIPFNKRLWSPSFGIITAGLTIFILAICYVIFDKNQSNEIKPFKKSVHWVLEAYGRNSFLVYFGKYVLYAVLINTSVTIGERSTSLNTLLMDFSGSFGLPAEIIYFIIYFGIWLVITLYAHKNKIYVKI
ncbi:heparan-alpha-glucosaminide N-acetyltransferase domain-containing protein [Oceanobacillus alkalisoli]|uniref:heparan-alpha-glucosaminide N-acetyltransferase domain-containing protein n=1 Tax=Oceanobacillus alkalisoli TaxID=2925113 RepID=UPI001EF0E997|nr:heparan-alpha-glucosaminide N-acetyltransferase domain-containing protein [Oceanobacillus alkalisoli]MCF3942680.1 heparan-alpha-glucosaminide N-acetyltransferase domain-containing protein [Oceanobacillus alkalisoli]MCG5102652.1 heparan-alpha-glucosaminide N-acetyltransferase domain-containing protein [Oceanobacillus alkalisoli]